MSRFIFALLLLHSTFAAAQVTVGDEIVSVPLPRQIAPASLAAPAVALARDHTGIAIAWTMANGSGIDAANRVYVTRLDELGNGGMIHTAIEKDLIGAGIVAAELAAPSAFAPAEMRAGDSSGEISFIQRIK